MTDYLLFIVSAFIFVVIALTLILSHVGRKHSAADSESTKDSDRQSLFRDWMATDLEVWGDRLSGLQAAILILLPIAAAAIGMTAFAIVFHIAERGALRAEGLFCEPGALTQAAGNVSGGSETQPSVHYRAINPAPENRPSDNR